MKKNIYLFAFFMCVDFFYAQTVTPTVFSSDGGSSSNAQGSIAWTIGESVSDTYSSGANITTMGFQQPELVDLATMIHEQSNTEEILIYPNPVKENIQISFKGIKNGTYVLVMVDALGKLIYSSETLVTENSNQFQIKLNEIAMGNYFLSVKGQDFNKTVKINKIN